MIPKIIFKIICLFFKNINRKLEFNNDNFFFKSKYTFNL